MSKKLWTIFATNWAFSGVIRVKYFLLRFKMEGGFRVAWDQSYHFLGVRIPDRQLGSIPHLLRHLDRRGRSVLVSVFLVSCGLSFFMLCEV